MKHFIITLMFVGLIMPPAFALSCMAPNIFRSAQFLHEQDEDYILFKGTVTLKNALEHSGYSNKPKPKRTKAQTRGINLLTNKPFNKSVTVQQHCLGPWCGSTAEKHIKGLIYIKKTDQQYTVALSPCGGTIFPAPEKDDETALIQCIKEQNCEKPPIQ